MPGLDERALAARLDPALAALFPGHALSAIQPLVGGASSLTFVAELTGGTARLRLVVKVAPPGLAPVGHRDVLRQAAVLRVLAATSVPVPAVVLEDPGAPPAVPPLFVTKFVDGEAVEPHFDREPPRISADEVRRRAFDAARQLVELQSVDATANVVGEVPASSTSEVERWARSLATVDAALVAGWESARDALLATAPADLPPVVTHGDYRLGNMLARRDRIVAIIDWELWGVGDPRLDLGWFRLNASPHIYGRATPLAGTMPSPDALLRHVEARRGAPVDGMQWFDALARFKTSATWALILKHARRAGVTTYDDVAPVVPRLLEEARHLVT